MSEVQSKTCTKCGADKPLTEFSGDITKHDGLRCWCKTCVKQYRAQVKANRPSPTHRHCRGCGAEKLLAEFLGSKRKDGLYNACTTCRDVAKEATRERDLVKKRQWHAENRDYVQKKKKEYNAKNRTKYLERKLAYHYKNRERILKEKRQRYDSEKVRAEYAANKEHYSAKARRSSTGYSNEDFKKALRVQECVCAICETHFDDLPSSAVHADHDHLTGEKRGVLCRSCNHGLGLFNDSTILLRRAAEYLENPPLRGVL